MIKFKSLKRDKDFLRIFKKKKLHTMYFTIYFEKKLDSVKMNYDKNLNISIVVKKKIGNAVVRNKIKRKLKNAVQKVIKEKRLIDLNYTYIILGKNNVYKDKFSMICNVVNATFKKIKQLGN